MPAYINTNIASLNAQRNLNTSQSALQVSLQRLSSGLRVNSAKDDAAGLAIGERMNGQVRGMTVAIRNANDGISLAQTAEGALATAGDILQRMRELLVQAVNGTNGPGEKQNLQNEYAALAGEITRLSTDTKFNNIAVIGAAGAGTFNFQVGANANETISVTTTDLSTLTNVATALTLDLTTATTTDITTLDGAIDDVAGERANLGAAQSRLEFAVNNLQVSRENQAAARSRIMDADFAAETAQMTRNQILQQAGTAMLAQANQVPNTVLTLLR